MSFSERRNSTDNSNHARWSSVLSRFGLPRTDIVLASYACALKQKKLILLQGRLYVFPHHVGFACDLLGNSKTIKVRIADIIAINKKTTIKFIPNAIEIVTNDGRFVFTSFLTRNDAFRVLHDLWAIASGISAIEEQAAPAPSRELTLPAPDQAGEEYSSFFVADDSHRQEAENNNSTTITPRSEEVTSLCLLCLPFSIQSIRPL